MEAPIHLYNKITPKTPNVYTFLRVFFLSTIKNEGTNFFFWKNTHAKLILNLQ